MKKIFTYTVLLYCYTTCTFGSNKQPEQIPETPAVLAKERSTVITSSSFSRPSSALLRENSHALSESYDADRDNSNSRKYEKITSTTCSKHLMMKALKSSHHKTIQILQERITTLEGQFAESEKKLHNAQHGWQRTMQNNTWLGTGICLGIPIGFATASGLTALLMYKGVISINFAKVPSLFQQNK